MLHVPWRVFSLRARKAGDERVDGRFRQLRGPKTDVQRGRRFEGDQSIPHERELGFCETAARYRDVKLLIKVLSPARTHSWQSSMAWTD